MSKKRSDPRSKPGKLEGKFLFEVLRVDSKPDMIKVKIVGAPEHYQINYRWEGREFKMPASDYNAVTNGGSVEVGTFAEYDPNKLVRYIRRARERLVDERLEKSEIEKRNSSSSFATYTRDENSA